MYAKNTPLKLLEGIVSVSREMEWPCSAVTDTCLSSLFGSCCSCRHLPGDGLSVISALVYLFCLFLSNAWCPQSLNHGELHSHLSNVLWRCPFRSKFWLSLMWHWNQKLSSKPSFKTHLSCSDAEDCFCYIDIIDYIYIYIYNNIPMKIQQSFFKIENWGIFHQKSNTIVTFVGLHTTKTCLPNILRW